MKRGYHGVLLRGWIVFDLTTKGPGLASIDACVVIGSDRVGS